MKSALVKFRNLTNKFLKDVSGASLIEYSVLLGVVLAVAVGAIVLVGNKVNNTFNKVQNAINQ
jgi:Flp pilus assembly pilin Flp